MSQSKLYKTFSDRKINNSLRTTFLNYWRHHHTLTNWASVKLKKKNGFRYILKEKYFWITCYFFSSPLPSSSLRLKLFVSSFTGLGSAKTNKFRLGIDWSRCDFLDSFNNTTIFESLVQWLMLLSIYIIPCKMYV